MRVTVLKGPEIAYAEAETCLVIPVYERDFPLMSNALVNEDELILQALFDKEVFLGKTGEAYCLPRPTGPYKAVLIVGLGKKEACSAEALRRAAGVAAELFRKHRVTHVYLDASHHPEWPVTAFLEGIVLGQYDFDVYKKPEPDSPAPIKVQDLTILVSNTADGAALQQEAQLAVLICLSANGARHLANTAPNEMNPSALAAFAQGIADESGCECTILDEMQMASLGMNALLGVARGSAQPPKFIVLRYHYRDDARTIAIVGKGITFDSGGISIKPAENMHEMKYDMCGAAAVLCTMLSIVEFKPKLNVVCVVPSSENMTGDAAQRPGDIVKAYNGTTIEILNTDAEGRLVLADALAYTVDKYKPDAIVDLATLTGSVVVALGHYAAGVLGNNEALITSLCETGEKTGERLWHLPLWEEYERLIDGTHADVANIGPRGEAGVITGAAFLKRFVGDTPWAHLDIAGTAWGAKNVPYLSDKHASGFGVRLLVHWLLSQQEPS
ncbi:MAG: leucyl aminopeptidase [Candidatus Hydrogenedentes bacterium]|nr:leucyl aminopeptidase [Candidatus Hydrogenedentota bacterium]